MKHKYEPVKHTPGPFTNNGLYIQQKSSGRILATIEQDGSRPEDVKGNLTLFTLSPEMLRGIHRAIGTLYELRNSPRTSEAWQRIPLYIRSDLEALEGDLTELAVEALPVGEAK
jgi:hypothetical protein